MRFPKHAFAVQTVLRRCLLVNFAVDPDQLARALPAHIEPDVYGDEAYVSVVVGQMDKMRLVGVPHALGISYNQIVYRAVVRCGDERGALPPERCRQPRHVLGRQPHVVLPLPPLRSASGCATAISISTS